MLLSRCLVGCGSLFFLSTQSWSQISKFHDFHSQTVPFHAPVHRKFLLVSTERLSQSGHVSCNVRIFAAHCLGVARRSSSRTAITCIAQRHTFALSRERCGVCHVSLLLKSHSIQLLCCLILRYGLCSAPRIQTADSCCDLS